MIEIAFVALIALIVAAAMTDWPFLDNAVHLYLQLGKNILIVILLRWLFRNQITTSKKGATVAFGIILGVEFILDTVRTVLSNGHLLVLLMPLSIPLCFLVVMYYTAKDSRNNMGLFYKSLWIGIPWTMLSLAFEIISFVS